LQLESIVNPATLPPEYSFDVAHPNSGVPLKMFGNDRYGDCVIAARAHQTLRFEFIEQKKVLPISDKEVLNEYFKETGGGDSGLYILDSLKAWQRGWKAGGKTYKIQVFAEIDRASRNQLKQTIFADIGAVIGVSLPASAMKEFDAGKPWSSTKGRGQDGHCVFVVGYTTVGPVCVTWAQRQQMTWAWYFAYADEAYAVIDALNTPKTRRLIDAGKIENFLSTL
jgi:hypothetical protein